MWLRVLHTTKISGCGQKSYPWKHINFQEFGPIFVRNRIRPSRFEQLLSAHPPQAFPKICPDSPEAYPDFRQILVRTGIRHLTWISQVLATLCLYYIIDLTYITCARFYGWPFNSLLTPTSKRPCPLIWTSSADKKVGDIVQHGITTELIMHWSICFILFTSQLQCQPISSATSKHRALWGSGSGLPTCSTRQVPFWRCICKFCVHWNAEPSYQPATALHLVCAVCGDHQWHSCKRRSALRAARHI